MFLFYPFRELVEKCLDRVWESATCLLRSLSPTTASRVNWRFLERQERMGFGRHRFLVTPSSSQAKQIALALGQSLVAMSSSTWIPDDRRESSQQSPLHTFPCYVPPVAFISAACKANLEHTHTLMAQSVPILNPQTVRSAVLPPLSTVEVLLTDHFPLCGPQRIQAFLGAALSLSLTNLVYLASDHIRAQSSKRHP